MEERIGWKSECPLWMDVDYVLILIVMEERIES